MHGIKISPQDFALKMQGGIMREGGHICGYEHVHQYMCILYISTCVYCTSVLVYTVHTYKSTRCELT